MAESKPGPKYYVGQRVILRESHRTVGDKIVEVVKVGLTRVYVKRYGREMPFLMETGRTKNGYARILTFAEAQALKERAEIERNLKSLGIETWKLPPQYSNEALRRVVETLTEDRKRWDDQ